MGGGGKGYSRATFLPLSYFPFTVLIHGPLRQLACVGDTGVCQADNMPVTQVNGDDFRGQFIIGPKICQIQNFSQWIHAIVLDK